MNIIRADISTLRTALDSRKIGAEELCREYLKRISLVDGEIKSYITVTEDMAMSMARAAQRLIDRGEAAPLTGIPVAVKDNICTKNIRTTCASRMLEDFVPPYSATAVEKLSAQGAVLLGKTSLDEFAMGGSNQTSAFAKTVNPYDTTRVAGGSSGGSAAAVSASLACCALGSDTGGSVRQPAAFCGVTGIKPTYGRVSRYGLVAFASSLDQIGAICGSALDCATVLNAICGKDSMDATSASVAVPDFTQDINTPVKGLRIAVPKEFFSDDICGDVRSAVMSAARSLEKQGAQLVDCSMPAVKFAVPAYYLIACAEAASNLSRFDGVKFGHRSNGTSYEELITNSRSEGFGWEVKRRILLGNYALSSGYYDAYYKKALALRQRLIQEYEDVFRSADVILTPTAPAAAYKVGSQDSDPVKMYLADICTVGANIAALPAISTTCGYSAEGMPIGMSLTGRRFDEQTILRCAHAFEKGFEVRLPSCKEVQL